MKHIKKYKYVHFLCFFSMRSFYIFLWWLVVFCMSFILYLKNKDYISMFCGIFSFCLFINDGIILWNVFKEISFRQLNFNKYCDLAFKVKLNVWNEINYSEEPLAIYIRSLIDDSVMSEQEINICLLMAYRTFVGDVFNDDSSINSVFFCYFVELVRNEKMHH